MTLVTDLPQLRCEELGYILFTAWCQRKSSVEGPIKGMAQANGQVPFRPQAKPSRLGESQLVIDRRLRSSSACFRGNHREPDGSLALNTYPASASQPQDLLGGRRLAVSGAGFDHVIMEKLQLRPTWYRARAG